MKILYLTDEIPYPPNNGIRIVPYNAMRLMHEMGHEVALCTLTAETDDGEASLESRFRALSGIASPDSWWMPVSKRRRFAQTMDTLRGKLTYLQQFRSEEFAKRFLKTVAEFKPDVVHFDFINMTQYISCLPSGIGSIASVNDCHTLTLKNRLASESFSGLQKYVKTLQLFLTRNYEIETYPRFGYTHLMTDVDASFLRGLNPAIRTRIIPNGVPAELFTVKASDEQNCNIIFVGKLFGFNLCSLRRFVADGWPRARRGSSNCRLKVIGEITGEAQDWVGHISAAESDIQFVGYVPRLADAYEGSALAVVPLDKNSGIINKAIEAMAAGVAVVAFSSVFEGISGAEHGVHYLGASSYADLGECVKRLLDNPAERMAIARAGRSLAEKCYAWPAKGKEYESMYLAARKLALA